MIREPPSRFGHPPLGPHYVGRLILGVVEATVVGDFTRGLGPGSGQGGAQALGCVGCGRSRLWNTP